MITCDECGVEIDEISAQFPLNTPSGKMKLLCIKCYLKHVRGEVL